MSTIVPQLRASYLAEHNADKTVKSYQSFLHERPMIVLTVGLTMAVEAL